MEPISTALAGLQLARSAVNFIKENLETVNDAKQIGEQLSNIFKGHSEFNRKRFRGEIKDVASELIEMKLQQEQLSELRQMVNMRWGHGFYEEIQKEYNKRIREEREHQKRLRLQKRKRVEHIIIGGALIGALGIVGAIMWVAIIQLRS